MGSRKIIAWGVGLGLLLGVAGNAPADDGERTPMVTIEADHEDLLAVIKQICAKQNLNFVASDAALDRAGKVSLSLRDVPLEQALDVICETYGLEAHVRSRILMVRARDGSSSPAPAREAPARRKTFLDDSPAPPPHADREPSSQAAAPESAPVSTVALARHDSSTSSGGHILVGTVVEVAKDSIKVKEGSGDPRELLVDPNDDLGGRSVRLEVALKSLKVGDRIALEYRLTDGHAFITNLVGGGNPQNKP